MKHTPGPYRILEIIPNCESAKWVKAKEGHDAIESQTDIERRITICSTTKHMENVFGSCEGGHLAELHMAYGEEGRQQALANAHLFSAAPELLEACIKMYDHIFNLRCQTDIQMADMRDFARNAIAKAGRHSD
ncbi:MAG: hypothetical protein ACOY46_03095 [Bacillota bacterium]